MRRKVCEAFRCNANVSFYVDNTSINGELKMNGTHLKAVTKHEKGIAAAKSRIKI